MTNLNENKILIVDDDQDIIELIELILKNVLYIEDLVNDLKLTYQLQNDMMPVCKQREYFVASAAGWQRYEGL